MNPDEKETSLNKIVDAINSSDVAVFSIMDYWTFDGFEEINDHVKSNKAILDKTVFPGMELRVEAPVDYRLNVQVLLSDQLTRQQRIDFKATLRLRGSPRPVSEEALIEFAKSLSPDNASKLGFTEDYANDNEKLLDLGSKTAEVTRESLVKAKDSIPEGTCLIILPYDTSDGLADLDWAKHSSADQYFMQSADMFETRAPENVDLFLGRRTEANEAFFDNFLKTMGGKPKPAISGSDAHRVTDYGIFPSNRITWIKADPTFEGLKKTLIEPEGRVFIGECPEQLEIIEERPTKFIDSVSIKKMAESDLTEHWFDCEIPINPGLVAIIGNKGNGKSALGETIGLLGKTANTRAFSFLSNRRFRQPKNNKAKHFEGSLVWASGNTESMSLDKDPDSNAFELVKYIPQNYLETLCNELGSADEEGFDDELRSVIFSHVPKQDRLGQNSLEDLIVHQTAQSTEKIEILQKELSRITTKIVELDAQESIEHKTKIEGALAAKQQELKSHNQNIPTVAQKPEGTDAEKEKLDALSKQFSEKKTELEKSDAALVVIREELSSVNLRISAAQRLAAKIDNFERQIETFRAETAVEIEALDLKEADVFEIKLNKGPVTKKQSGLLVEKGKLELELKPEENGSKAAAHAKILAELKVIQNQLNAPQKAHEAYLERKSAWEKTRSRIVGSTDTPESVVFYEEELKKIEAVPSKIAAQRSVAIEKTKDIFREKVALAKVYRTLYDPVQNFMDSSSVAKDQLQLRFKVEIADTGFGDTFFTHVSQGVRGTYCGAEEGRKRLNKLLTDNDLATEDGIVLFVEKLIKSLLVDERDGETSTNVKDVVRKGQTIQSLYDFVYGLNYLHPRYSLGITDKPLSELSPGERGALLLVFYLLVDQNESPLVIDQPEENLDNQTVYDLLVPCIKEAKKRRQIIVITHNPNLAVVCDAEQIICCSINKHDGNRLSYESGAIENPKINKAIVDILEGTRPAFENRGAKYSDNAR